MTGYWPAACATGAAAVALWPSPATFVASAAARDDERTGLSAGTRRALFVGVALLAAGLLGDWWPWWLTAVLASVAAAATRLVPARPGGADRAAERQLLAVHADLLAACLDAGMPMGAALLAVPRRRTVVPRRAPDPPDPLSQLDGVAALLMLGADPARAWASVHHADLAGLAAAASRSSAGGTTLADAVREHATTLRSAAADAAERSAGRAGVAMTAPLGLCFLPAFLCLGLAPVVVGLLATLHLF